MTWQRVETELWIEEDAFGCGRDRAERLGEREMGKGSKTEDKTRGVKEDEAARNN